ncbi:DoxX family protein [Halomarina pelagica]|uniref:DoxX family protein n=1 Tax=Halomarina pelagica TaxID=2961599 RepID=UPI0020C4D591|nr:DoxX family protein [Halomarina sp. BND7]
MSESTDDATDAPPSRLARLLFGGVLAFMALDNFRNLEGMIGYAEGNGVPKADLAVPFASGALLSGGVGIALWRLPRLAAGAVATFFLGVTPLMHDFWNREGEEKQAQQIHFLKNLAPLGAAIAFLVRGGRRCRT